jgi:replicative DNA helicase
MQEIEIALMGACVIDPTVIDPVLGVIGPAEFTDRILGQCFGLMVDMHAAGEKVGDTAVLVSRLRGAKLLDAVGGVAGIGRWAVGCPNASHAIEYARKIKRASSMTNLRHLGTELSRESESPTADPSQIVDWLEGQLSRFRSGVARSSQTLAESMEVALDEILAVKNKTRVAAMPTGLMQLDSAIGGLYPGELIIVAARPSIGKTALGAQFALHNAEQGRQTLFVSLEMEGKEIAMRQLAAMLGYEVRVLRSGRVDETEIAAIQRHIEKSKPLPFHIVSERSPKMAKITAAAKVHHAANGLSMLLIDYIGLIASHDRRRERHESVAEITSELKSLAMELQIPVVALCQLNREAEKGKPSLNHLRESGSIEQDADVVMLLHRETRDSPVATIDIAKCRNGATGEISVSYDCAATRFFDVVDSYEHFS